MKKDFRVTLNGHRYRVVQIPLDDEYGRVDFDLGRISIDLSIGGGPLGGQVELLIHEALHVLAPNWKEERVLQAGKDLARMLVTAGVINGKKKTKG
jgi:hypothetical protein